jgi:hypothetical protein
MRVMVKLLVIGMCLSCVALLGACGSKQAGPAAPTSSPLKTQTRKLQATAYLTSLAPVLAADKALLKRFGKLPAQLGASDAFSMAVVIKNSYLPAIEQIQARLAAIKPPPGFRVAHARLEEACADENDLLYFLWDGLQGAIYTHTVEPGFLTAANRHITRLEKAFREWSIAIRAAAKRSGVKAPPRLPPVAVA